MKLPSQSSGVRRAGDAVLPVRYQRGVAPQRWAMAARGGLDAPTAGFGLTAGNQVLEDCKYGGHDYTEGSTLCQAGSKHKCIKIGDGSFVWNDEGVAC